MLQTENELRRALKEGAVGDGFCESDDHPEEADYEREDYLYRIHTDLDERMMCKKCVKELIRNS